MTIEGELYKLKPISDSSPFYDLELLYDIGGKNPRQEFKVECYGITLENALSRICNYYINKNHKDEAITLKQFVKEYKEALENFREEIFS